MPQESALYQMNLYNRENYFFKSDLTRSMSETDKEIVFDLTIVISSADYSVSASRCECLVHVGSLDRSMGIKSIRDQFTPGYPTKT